MKSLKSCDTHRSEPLRLQQWDTSRWWSIYAPPVRHGYLSAHLSQTQWEEFQRICQHLEVSFEAWCTRWKCDLKPEMMQWCNGNISDPNMEEKPTGFCHLHSHHTLDSSLLSCQGLLQAKVHHPSGPEAKRAKKHPQWHRHLKWADTMNLLAVVQQVPIQVSMFTPLMSGSFTWKLWMGHERVGKGWRDRTSIQGD